VAGAAGRDVGHPVEYLREQAGVALWGRVAGVFLGPITPWSSYRRLLPGLVLIVVVVVGCLLRCG
jgi:hypothetical protein